MVYLVIDKESEECEHKIHINEENPKEIKYDLTASSNPSWTFPGEHQLSIIDYFNGMKIKFPTRTVKLDYSEFSKLVLLSNFIKQHDSNLMPTYGIVAEASIKEI